MILLWFVVVLLCLYQIQFSFAGKNKITDKGKMYSDYMSREKTASIKGIFILIVLISHISLRLNLSDSVLNKVFLKANFDWLAQSMVVMFMFYSGFGIMLSALNKGKQYYKSIPIKRVLKVLVHFDIAVVIILVIKALIGVKLSPSQVLLSFLAWDNWYIFAILILYLISYFAFMIGKNNKAAVLSISFALTIVYILVLHLVNKDIWWYDTVILYPIGMLYYTVKDKIENLFKNKPFIYWSCLIISAVVFCASLLKQNYFVVLEIKHILFGIIVVLLTMKIQIHNKILSFCGKHLFSIYILQTLPLTVFAHFKINNSHPLLFIFLTIASTFVLAVPFDLMLNKLDKLIFDRRVKNLKV